VRNDVLKNRADDVKKVLEIINQACADLMESPQACEMISKRYQLRLSEVKEWFSQTTWSTDFEKPTEAIKNIKTYLQKLEIVTPEQCDSREVWFDLADGKSETS